MEEESLSQCCQRILRVLAADGTLPMSTDCLQNPSTRSMTSFASTDLSTEVSTLVEEALTDKLPDLDARFAAIEERLGKLRA